MGCLYVMCVGVIVFPFDNVILIGQLAGRFFATVVPSLRIFSIAPELDKSCCMSRFIFGVLILVVAIERSCVLLACTIDFPAVCCVFLSSGTGLPKPTGLVISGMPSSTLAVAYSFVVIVPSYDL